MAQGPAREAEPVAEENFQPLTISAEQTASEQARARKENHPYLAPYRQRAMLPFSIAALLAFAVLPLTDLDEVNWVAVGIAVGLVVAEGVAVFVAPWRSLPAWTRMLPPITFLIAIAALREAVGGSGSGYVVLMLMVPIWAALFEGRKSLIAAVLAVAVAVTAPVLLLDSARYDTSIQLRMAILMTGLSGFIGFAVQRLVHQARERNAEVARSRRFFMAIMNSAAEGIVSLDSHGRVVFANPRALKMLGFSSEQFVGAPFHALVHHSHADGSHYPASECPIRRTLLNGESITVDDDVLWRRDGSFFPVVYRSAGLLGEDDERHGAVVSFVDISEQRRIEQMKDELLSVVGHELRTPLTSIRGSLGLIAGGAAGPVAPEAERMIEIAVTNTDRLVRLINDILDFERIESGRVEMARRLCDARELIEQAVETMRSLAERCEVELRAEPVDAPLWADPDRILQALMNLISNAIKFSEEGQTVRVGVTREGRELCFFVEDHGRGIPADKIDSVFERFAQVDASDSREKGGTGLGLPISRSIIHQHGGRIWIDSELGRGATIHFALPALPTASPGADDDQGPPGPLALVIEDDEDLAQVLEAMLVSRGVSVWRAGGASDAVDLLTRRRPDLITLDLVLPEGDGAELVRWMNYHPELADVPLAVYTERDITEEDRRDLRLGPTILQTKSRLKPSEFANRAIELIDETAHVEAPSPAPEATER
jgi:PAS domain S-box-containing protein